MIASEDVVANDARPGYRLARLEIYNWGTFDKHVWALSSDSKNVLVTGDIGSGKSTLVDALTTLLVPPQRVAYNKAAGAEARERTLPSYVLGHYKSERGDVGLAARPVALRGRNDYSVLLATFDNGRVSDAVTLIKTELQATTKEKEARAQRADVYDRLATAVNFAPPQDSDAFVENRRAAEAGIEATQARQGDVQNALMDATVEFRKFKQRHDEIDLELRSLRQRRSNIPANMLAIRNRICDELDLREEDVPIRG
jgi:uncharacterized protein YPO0396